MSSNPTGWNFERCYISEIIFKITNRLASFSSTSVKVEPTKKVKGITGMWKRIGNSGRERTKVP